MPEENEIETPAEEQVTTEEKPAEAGSEEGAKPEGEEENPDNGGDELPEWARTKLTKANAEAANYRTKLREAEQKLADAKTPEQVEEILNQFKADREADELKQAEEARALLIENIALHYKLPEKLAKRLQGANREELEADAKELAKDYAVEDDDEIRLEGGLSPRNRDADAGLSPRELAQRHGGRKPR